MTASKRFVFPGPLTVYKFFKLKLLVIQYTLHILIITEIFGVQLTLTYAHRCNLSSSTYIHMYVLYVCASLCFAIFFLRHPYIWSATILHSIVYVFHAHTPAYLVCSSQLWGKCEHQTLLNAAPWSSLQLGRVCLNVRARVGVCLNCSGFVLEHVYNTHMYAYSQFVGTRTLHGRARHLLSPFWGFPLYVC